MSPYNDDEVPDSEDEMPARPKDGSSSIGVFTTPSLAVKGSCSRIAIPSESISEFTTSNPSNFPGHGSHDHIPADISNFTTTISSNKLPTPSAIDNNSSTLPRTLLSPGLLAPNIAQLSSSPPRPKPRYKPRLTDNSASTSSPAKATPRTRTLPLSPPATELKGRTAACAQTRLPSTSVQALQRARRPIGDAKRNPPESRLHSSSAVEAPALIDISSSEDEWPKPVGKRKPQLITDDEHEPGDYVHSPVMSKVKRKKSKRIETDDEVDPTEAEYRGVNQVQENSDQEDAKYLRPGVLPYSEDVDELDLIGAPLRLKTKEKEALTKPRMSRGPKSKKGETQFKSRELIEDSDKESHAAREFPREDDIHNGRHAIAEVTIPFIVRPTISALPASHTLPRDPAPRPNISPPPKSLSVWCPQGELDPSPAEISHKSNPTKRKTPEIQGDCVDDDESRRDLPASPPAKKKRRKNVVESDEDEKRKLPKPRKSKSKASVSAKQRKSGPPDGQGSGIGENLVTRAGATPQSSAPPNVEDAPLSKRRKSSSKSKSRVVLSDEDEENATSARHRGTFADAGKPLDGNEGISETTNTRDTTEHTRAEDGRHTDPGTRPGKAKVKSTVEQVAPVAPALASSVTNEASNPSNTAADAPASPESAVAVRRKSEPLYSTKLDKPREALTITEILLKAGLNAPLSTIKPRQGLSRTHRIAPLHSRIATPPPRPLPIPKAKKAKKNSEGEYDSEEEYELEGLTEKEKRKRREEKRNRLLYSP